MNRELKKHLLLAPTALLLAFVVPNLPLYVERIFGHESIIPSTVAVMVVMSSFIAFCFFLTSWDSLMSASESSDGFGKPYYIQAFVLGFFTAMVCTALAFFILNAENPQHPPPLLVSVYLISQNWISWATKILVAGLVLMQIYSSWKKHQINKGPFLLRT